MEIELFHSVYIIKSSCFCNNSLVFCPATSAVKPQLFSDKMFLSLLVGNETAVMLW